MEQKFFTILLACKTTTEDFQASVASWNEPSVHIIAFRTKECELISGSENGNCQMVEQVFDNVYEGYETLLQQVDTEYVQFCYAGDIPERNSYAQIKAKLDNFCVKSSSDSVNLLYVNSVYDSDLLNEAGNAAVLHDFEENAEQTLLTLQNVIFRTSLAKQYHFSLGAAYDNDLCYLYDVLSEQKFAYYFSDSRLYLKEPAVNNYVSFPYSQEKGWYGDTLKDGYIALGNRILEKQQTIPRIVQYGFFHALQMRFAHNLNTKNKHVYDKDIDVFWDICHEFLEMIDDSIILNVGKYKTFQCSNSLKIHLMRLKYGKDLKMQYAIDAHTKNVLLGYHNILFEKFSAQKIVVDAINVEKDQFILEASFMEFVPRQEYELHAILGEKEIEIINTCRYAKIEYFGVSVRDKRTFMLKIPFEDLKKDEIGLKIYGVIENVKCEMKFESSRFPSRVTTKVKNAYWKAKGYLLKYNPQATELIFYQYSGKRRVSFELHYLKTIFKSNKRAVVLRLLYWLTYPYFKNRRIWLTFDKMYKTGDNGDYFYRYALKQNDGIEVRYVANKGYPDTIQMQKEKLNPLLFATIKQRLYFLHASIVAATHANIPVFSGTAPAKFIYTQDLFKGEVVCIQHGLAVQQLAHNLNSQYDNTKRFYCASPYEIKNLSQPEYGYYDKKALSLVGLARYDGLVNNDQRQILITPTWRAYIAMPTSIGNARPYSPDFKNTVYYNVFNSLIKNEKLIKTAKECGYRIVYLLHPVISSQLEDFQPGEGVEVKSPVGINYEQILTQSSLMVTDYSGVQFDFAYMRKPVVYFHTPLLPPHYEEGGFFYDTMGFGEICDTEKVLVDTLCDYMKRECQMNDFYRKRADEFFGFSDHNNCERIYNEIKEFDDLCHS